MSSNDRPLPYGEAPDDAGTSRFPASEETLRTEKIQVERKTFVFTLKENPRGRFLRITEDVGGRRDTIIVPAPGLEDFGKVIDEMAQASADIPPKILPEDT